MINPPSPMPTNLMQLSVKPLNNTRQPPHPSLLDTLPIWLDTPSLAYSSWVKEQNFRPSVKVVYSAMFARFAQWLSEKKIRLDRCSGHDIGEFLNAINTNLPKSRRHVQESRQRQQYLRNLEHVYSHLGSLGFTGDNPARQASIQKAGGGKDKPTRILSVEERQAVIALVQAKLDELSRDEKSLDRWMEFRDIALIGATIGAGMKPSHLHALTLNCIRLEEGVIDNSVAAHSHRAAMLPFARDSMAAWLNVRSTLCAETLSLKGRAGGTPDQWRKLQAVFIADRSSHGFGRFSTTQRMHPSSIFRRIQAFLVMAGVTGSRASAQTLRNTYAALLIEGGASNTELVTCLGLQNEVTAQRIRISCGTRKLSDETI